MVPEAFTTLVTFPGDAGAVANIDWGPAFWLDCAEQPAIAIASKTPEIKRSFIEILSDQRLLPSPRLFYPHTPHLSQNVELQIHFRISAIEKNRGDKIAH
jgi:hypothetical protein